MRRCRRAMCSASTPTAPKPRCRPCPSPRWPGWGANSSAARRRHGWCVSALRRSFRCKPADRDDGGCRYDAWAFSTHGRLAGQGAHRGGLSIRPCEHINSAKEYCEIQREKAMIIEGPDHVTQAVLEEIARAPNPRFREVMTALVKHLHGFIREAKLTEEEFHQGCAIINSIGQSSNAFHNEAVLMSGSLGVSTLVCLLNNGKNGATETTANLLGPFWRLDSPRTENGGSIIRSPTPGPELFCNITVVDRAGLPIADAEVDV